MRLLRALRCILCCGDDEDELHFYGDRNYRDYSRIISPSRSAPPQNHHSRDAPRPPLPPARSLLDSRADATKARFPSRDSPVVSSPLLSSSIMPSPSPTPSSRNPSLAFVSSTNYETLFAASMSKLPSSSSKPPSSYVPSSIAEPSPIISPSRSAPPQNHHSHDAPRPPLPAACSLLDSRADATKARYPPRDSPVVSSPLLSSSIMPPPSPTPSSRNPSLPFVSSTNNETLFAASLSKLPSSSSKSPSSYVPSSIAEPSPIISPSRSAPPQNHHSHDAPRPPLPPARSLLDSRAEATKARFPPRDSPVVSSPLLSSSIMPSPSPTPSSRNPSLPFVSSTNNETLFSASLSKLPSSSSKPPSSYVPSSIAEPSPVPVSSTDISFSGDGMRIWREKKQTSMVPSGGSLQKLPALSPFLIKLPSPDDASSSSSSETSSPLSSVGPLMRNRRVLPKYEIPKNLEEMIKKDIVPPILYCPLSPSTYADYFATLLYAEDFYIEKWSKFLLKGVTLELRPKITSPNSQQISVKRKTDMLKNNMLFKRDFVSFKVDSIPEKRPYLLSRDFVFLRPLNEIARTFKGRVFRVVKSTTVLVEFGDNFFSQHSPSKRYDVSFSFNRVCLKRAHHAISAAADPSFHRILFPDRTLAPFSDTINLHENTVDAQLTATRILNHKGPCPLLIEGPISVRSLSDENDKRIDLTTTGVIIQKAILRIYSANPHCRILVCSPKNTTSDILLRSLLKVIPDWRVFRANAAFRDYMLVPDDIIPASLYEEEEECFSCPPLAELLNFNVITSTFMSSFRLCAAGIDTKHFTHIFLVDASLVTEPETIVPLANFAGENTVIIVTGCLNKFPNWVRADIARRYGLKRSYFHRLCRGNNI